MAEQFVDPSKNIVDVVSKGGATLNEEQTQRLASWHVITYNDYTAYSSRGVRPSEQYGFTVMLPENQVTAFLNHLTTETDAEVTHTPTEQQNVYRVNMTAPSI